MERSLLHEQMARYQLARYWIVLEPRTQIPWIWFLHLPKFASMMLVKLEQWEKLILVQFLPMIALMVSAMSLLDCMM
jgi:hypothetical protein